MTSRPACPVCGSPAIVHRFTMDPISDEAIYVGRICKSCEHMWWPKEGEDE